MNNPDHRAVTSTDMKTLKPLLAIVFTLGLLSTAPKADAGGFLNISIGSSGYRCAPPVNYYRPRPVVYVRPAPVYYRPAPVYYRSRSSCNTGYKVSRRGHYYRR